MNNEHPCLVKKLEEMEEKIESGGLKVVSFSLYDTGINTDIIIPSTNIIPLNQLDLIRNADIICDGIVGAIPTRYYTKSYITDSQVRFTSFNDMSLSNITMIFDSDGTVTTKYDDLKSSKFIIFKDGAGGDLNLTNFDLSESAPNIRELPSEILSELNGLKDIRVIINSNTFNVCNSVMLYQGEYILRYDSKQDSQQGMVSSYKCTDFQFIVYHRNNTFTFSMN